MQIAVKDLLPNPFRHLERYPVNQEKVDALRRSIKDTGFWDNLLVRKANGGYELAYGHHRHIALKKEHVETVDLPVRNLSDTDMARIMAHENMEEWGHSAAVEQETVRSIIEAYAEGKIELPKPSPQAGQLRYAPSFTVEKEVSGSAQKLPYSVESLTKFLGWNRNKVESALAGLALIEEDLASEEDFADLKSEQARRVAVETRRVLKETKQPGLAKAIGKRLAAGMRKSVKGYDKTGKERKLQDVTVHNARQKANEMMGTRRAKPEKKLPPIERFCHELAKALVDVFPTPRMQEKLNAIIKHRGDLRAQDRKLIVGALRGLAKRATSLADRIEG